ncbi:FMN-dependent NADH-azoreductase [Paenibacillus sp. NEAU-GSW1]|uniref:FMN-dependent NADH-azoreductase n=1 Tax=Paenibacillus sp. NEAU-GSW1 TaxID=2682486 RepID=UPI0012E0D7AA|nr:FMN-dependent NADH-azoreductase [Paenibacillus sp. NEAU-GSW1]MUT65941.1 FMN-dependent NADH-azoreductase [Paenibacillus sp. NEAU-GSW1]
MSTLLYVTANPKAEQDSFSLSVARKFMNAYEKSNPEHRIIEVDLYQTQVPLLDRDVFNGWKKLQEGVSFTDLAADERSKLSFMNALLEQFVSADKYVFVTPMWNFGLPAIMKAYIDNVCIADKTFRYTENGPVGLLSGRKALHIQARGGIYSEGPLGDKELGDRYLRTVLSFMGISDVASIYVEGMGQLPSETERIRARSIAAAEQMALVY